MPLQQNFRPRIQRRAQHDFFPKDEDMTSRNSLPANQDKNNHQPSVKCRDIVTLNVGGLRFQTRRSTLRRYPETLLGSEEIEHYYEPETKEYFFDRNRSVFQPILGYYLSNGVMCLPSHTNPDIFVEELRFFKMGSHVISRFAVQNTSSQWFINQSFHFCHPLQKKIWICLDNPDSGPSAKAIAYLDLAIILIAVVAQCVESLPEIRRECENKTLTDCLSYYNRAKGAGAQCCTLLMIEAVSNVWFTVNFIARIICCPDKKLFAKSVLNWFDLLAILPFYLDLIFRSQKDLNLNFLMVLRFFRTLRIVRIFKMSRYFQGLFALGYALSSSAGELVILALMLVTFVVLFSSLIFFTEHLDTLDPSTCTPGPNCTDNLTLSAPLSDAPDTTQSVISSCVLNITEILASELTGNITDRLARCCDTLSIIVRDNLTISIPAVMPCIAPPSNEFDSIITGFWWSIITMSTVGYGDYAPKTPMGKVVGSLCALTGILVISLPFPLIINRFNNFMRLRSNGNSRYSTIENGLNCDIGVVPEYSGVAFGFFSKDKVPRVADMESTQC